ncbi:hypothetical protein C6W96_06135 [Streptomyces sp. CS149]|nr:hypothetical protein C6W96_06135 [Streptomyces sp. CS149]
MAYAIPGPVGGAPVGGRRARGGGAAGGGRGGRRGGVRLPRMAGSIAADFGAQHFPRDQTRLRTEPTRFWGQDHEDSSRRPEKTLSRDKVHITSSSQSGRIGLLAHSLAVTSIGCVPTSLPGWTGSRNRRR